MRILQVVHGFPPAAGGGTEAYVRDLADAFARTGEHHVAVFTRHADPRARELAIRRWKDGTVDVVSVNNTYQSCESFEASYTNPPIERIAGDFLDDWRPDIVHVQHLTCLSTGIPRQAATRRIPVVMTLNDYWMICHRGQLVDLAGRQCAGPWTHGCARCLPPGAVAAPVAFRSFRRLQSLPIPGMSAMTGFGARLWDAATPAERTRDATLARLNRMKSAVADVRFFLAPSETLAAAFTPFGLPRDRVLRCNQGISTSRFEGVRRTASSRLRIGFAGGLQPTKGADILIDAVERLPRGRVVVDLLGGHAAYHGDRRFAQAIEPRLGHAAIRRLGSVSHQSMPGILADLDVLIVPSIWIENAPFIIREAFAAGVPVIASDLGGMREMVRHEIDGLLFRPGDAAALADAIRRLLNEPELLATLRAGITRPMSIEEDAEWLADIYRRAGVDKHRASVAIVNSHHSATPRTHKVAGVLLNYQTPDQTYLGVRSLQSSFNRPTEILIVDNGSGDGSASVLQRLLTEVRIIESPNNAGFSGGCNVGIRAALDSGARFVLLMNSDAVLAPDALGHLIDGMSEHPEVGIVAPVLVSREEPDHISSAGISFSTRSGRMRHRAAGRRYSALGSDRFCPVDAVSGCVMLIRREVFDTIGLLDEAYFYSFEDVEFCLRARAAGFSTMCVQDARAYHEGGRSIGRRSARRVYFGTRNHLRLASQVGDQSTRPLRIAMVAALNAAYVLVSPESPLLAGSAAFVRGMWHHLRGRYGPG